MFLPTSLVSSAYVLNFTSHSLNSIYFLEWSHGRTASSSLLTFQISITRNRGKGLSENDEISRRRAKIALNLGENLKFPVEVSLATLIWPFGGNLISVLLLTCIVPGNFIGVWIFTLHYVGHKMLFTWIKHPVFGSSCEIGRTRGEIWERPSFTTFREMRNWRWNILLSEYGEKKTDFLKYRWFTWDSRKEPLYCSKRNFIGDSVMT